MIQGVDLLTQLKFDKGLITRSDILSGDKESSPNSMNVKWNFDSSIQKRYGSSTANEVALQSPGLGLFDFGATDLRWMVVSAGTAIYASSALGQNDFVEINTTQTAVFHHFERSKNVLVITSDAYDTVQQWAGSAGTVTAALNGSAPNTKYAINFQGFLVLLNSEDRPRIFSYEDENTQLTGDWGDNFDLPSSFDDQITTAFILAKRLYVSTRYKIYRVTFVGGNPDWSFLEVTDWGFVPRTAKKMTLRTESGQGGEVVIGQDWDRRVRAFDGSDNVIISDNIENDNSMCDFAINKISYAGSGLLLSNAEVDTREQEYRLNVAIGADSTDTTHAIVLNGRVNAFYPYDNQPMQSLVMAESANQRFLMGVDKSGFVHFMNSGNLDASTIAINDVYDSPFLFSKTPGEVSKGSHVDMYFEVDSIGTLHFNDRADLKDTFDNTLDSLSMTGDEKLIKKVHTINLESVQNVYQYRIMSSSSTANPWRLSRVDYYLRGLGIGKGI